MRSDRALLAGTLGLVGCSLLWSLSGVMIKSIAVEGVALAFYRSLIGGLLLAPLAWPNRRSLGRVAPLWPLLALAAFTLMSASFVIANKLTAAANAIILQYTSPVWVFLLAPLILHEPTRRREWLAVVIAMCGLGIIVAGNPGDLAGVSVALVSGFGYGAVTVFLRKLRPVHPAVVTTLNALGSALLLAPAVAIWSRFDLSLPQLVWVAALGVFQFTLPYVLFSWSLQRTPAAWAALITLLETVLNPLWTFLLLGERPPRATFAGGALILAAVILSVCRRSPGAASRARCNGAADADSQ